MVMEKYSSNYCSKDNNYIIEICYRTDKVVGGRLYSSLCVAENIIQRGNPTRPSNYLINNIGEYSINENLRYISNEKTYWDISVKGYNKENDNSALYFYKHILPKELKDYGFLTNLILPEAYINEITNEENNAYIDNTIDFYVPQLRLVIEIDGYQHKEEQNKISDFERDAYLKRFHINTLRINVNFIKHYIEGREDKLRSYTDYIYKLCKENKIINQYKDIVNNKLYYSKYKVSIIYDTILRFQILLIELLKRKLLTLEERAWIFNIKDDGYDIPYDIAIKDLGSLLCDIFNLQEIEFKLPEITINKICGEYTNNKGINIDISLFKKWDDAIEDNVCYVRAGYLYERNYFKVQTAELIEYKIHLEGEKNNVDSLYSLNKRIFGFDNFNNGQLPIIINALSKKDTVGLLPTGGGKSLCYQLCCILQPTINFVVVPIVSLMYDQKINLDKKGIVHSNYINKDQEGKEKGAILKDFADGKYFCIWISPERFQTKEFREQLKAINLRLNLGYAVIDEVHCLSEWGHDFRTSYLNLAKTIRNICPGMFFLGLTATASKNVLKDILVELEINEENVKTIIDYTRKELKFKVIQDKEGLKEDKYDNLTELLLEKNSSENILNLNDDNSKCGIVFTPHVNGQYGCYNLLNKLSQMKLFQGKIAFYSGEAPKQKWIRGSVFNDKDFNEYKKEVQEKFKNNKIPLLLTTKAFGMGIDKSNVRYTIHYGIPASIEAFYQEAGRAGRDRKEAYCYILNSVDEINAEEYNKIFALDTTVEELNDLILKYPYPTGDVLRNLFLAVSGHKGVYEDSILVYGIYKEFCLKGRNIITVSDIKKLNLNGNNVDCNFTIVQKAIYRLSLMGVVKDWLVEGWNIRGKFKVVIGDTSIEAVADSLNKYINKYDPEFDINNLSQDRYKKYIKILKKPGEDKIYKYICILIQWNYDNVFYGRRQSLKNLVDLCNLYFEKGEDYFKEVLEGYFKITDKSYVLDYLSNNPYDSSAMYQLLFDEEDNIKDIKDLREVNLSLTRFLESFRYNTALNYLSGILALLLNEYNDKTKMQRLKSAFSSINSKDDEYIKDVFSKTVKIGRKLNPKAKDILGELLCTKQDHLVVYKELGDNFSLNLVLNDSLKKLEEIGERISG